MSSIRLYYIIKEAPWTPLHTNKVCTYGLDEDSRYIPLVHVANLLGRVQEDIYAICISLPDVRKTNGPSYKYGFVYVETLPVLLKYLGWSEKDITKGMDMLKIEKGTRRRKNREEEEEEEEAYEGEEEDEEEEEHSNISTRRSTKRTLETFDPSECIAEMKKWMGPDAYIAFQITPAYEKLKKEIVQKAIEEHDEKIREKVRTDMEPSVIEDLRKTIEPKVRNRFENAKVDMRLQQTEALRINKSAPPRKTDSVIIDLINEKK